MWEEAMASPSNQGRTFNDDKSMRTGTTCKSNYLCGTSNTYEKIMCGSSLSIDWGGWKSWRSFFFFFCSCFGSLHLTLIIFNNISFGQATYLWPDNNRQPIDQPSDWTADNRQPTTDGWRLTLDGWQLILSPEQFFFLVFGICGKALQTICMLLRLL